MLRHKWSVKHFKLFCCLWLQFNHLHFYNNLNDNNFQFQNRTGCYITDKTDKILYPRKYETADEYHAKILEKVLTTISHSFTVTTCNIDHNTTELLASLACNKICHCSEERET